MKIDSWTKDELDQECAVSGMKRNRVINEAIRLYIRYQDARRYDRFCRHEGNTPDRRVVQFIRDMLHERAKMYLDLIDYY